MLWRHATIEEMLQETFSVDPVAFVAAQLCGKHISAAANQHTTIREAVFPVGPPRGCITRISRKMLHKDYYRMNSVEKKSCRGSQRAWRQDELIGGKLPVVK
jgi:hypothetical protein